MPTINIAYEGMTNHSLCKSAQIPILYQYKIFFFLDIHMYSITLLDKVFVKIIRAILYGKEILC